MSTVHCRSCGSEVAEGTKFCPQCGASIAHSSTDEANKQTAGKPNTKLIALAILIVVLGGGLSVYFGTLFREFHPVIANQPTLDVPIEYGVQEKIPSQQIDAVMNDGFMSIPLERVKSLKLVRFFDPEGIQAIPVIAYISPEGKLVTAISKSENCQSTDFYLEGHNIHCASCPSYWNMSSLEAYACCQRFYPDPIPSSVVGNEVRIDAKVVRDWRPRG